MPVIWYDTQIYYKVKKKNMIFKTNKNIFIQKQSIFRILCLFVVAVTHDM